MKWKYDAFSSRAEHLESKTVFGLQRGQKLESPSDFQLVPPEGQSKAWPQQKLEQLKQELWPEMKAVWRTMRLQGELERLIKEKCNDSPTEAARVISRIAKRDVSVRAVQSWLIDQKRKSSRPCPEWAVEALKGYMAPAIPSWAVPSAEQPWSMQVRDKFSVKFADNEIESDERVKKKWESAPLSSLPELLFEFEQRIWPWIYHLDQRQHLLAKSLRESGSFEEFKARTLAAWEDASNTRFFIDEAKRAMKEGADEFSSQEGPVAPPGKTQ